MIPVHPLEKPSRYYWGVDREATGPIFDTVWMAETLPPWRKSTKAIRIRLGNYALHLGLCKVMEEGDPLRGREWAEEITPEVIGTWGGTDDPAEEAFDHTG